MIKVRKFKKEDGRKVSNLIQKALIEVNSKDYSKDIINRLCVKFNPKNVVEISKKRDVYVAVENNKILGTASLDNNTILTVFVNPKFHKKGVGTLLIQYIERIAKRKGYKSVSLPASITAYGFYTKLGYKKVKEVFEKEYGKNIIMKKKL